MMWIRAVWNESNVEEEGVIPSNWIEEKTVRWPSTLNVLKPLAERRPPLENWHHFPLVKIKFQSDDKKMCDDYDFTTTAETSGGEEIFTRQTSKRKEASSCSAVVLPTPPRRYIESTPKTNRSRFSPRKFATAQRKTCPPKQKRQRSKSRSKSESPLLTRSSTLQLGSSCVGRLSRSPSPLSSSSRSPSRSPTPPPRRSPKRQESSSAYSKSSVSSSQSQLLRQRKELSKEERGTFQQSLVECFTSVEPERNGEKSSANQFPMPEGRFQKRVLHLLMEIRGSVKQVGKRCEPAESDCHINQATSVNEIKRLEETLLDEETRKLLTTRLSKVGGSTIKDNVRGVMNRLMTNEVMAGMNMNGNGGKVAFRKTALYEIITASVLVHHKGTEDDVCKAVSKFLKYAPDRKGGGGRNEKTA